MAFISNIRDVPAHLPQFFTSKTLLSRTMMVALPILVGVLAALAYKAWRNSRIQPPKPEAEKFELLDAPNGQPVFYQPQNPEIFKQIDVFNKALQTFIDSQPKGPSDAKIANADWQNKSEIETGYALLDALGKITQLAIIAEIPQLIANYADLRQKKGFTEIVTEVDYIKRLIISYVNLYRAIREGYKYGFERSRIDQSIQGVTFAKDATQSNPEPYQALFYQAGTDQYKLRTDYNQFCKNHFGTEASKCLDVSPQEWAKLEHKERFELRPIPTAPIKPVAK